MGRDKPFNPRPQRTTLETIDGWLVHAEVHGLKVSRDRAGHVLIALGADPRGTVLLDPADVARLHHALACALWPYGENPNREDPDS